MIDGKGRTVIPGLNDSHMHPIRGGLNYNMELRWDGVPSLADALRMLKQQAARTPAPQWVRVVGGWTEFQFAERRMPTLDEINAVSPDTPVFVLHLYDRALLNAAALRAVGYTKDTPPPTAGEIQHDHQGNPTGMLIAKPNAMILYATLAKGPKLSREDQLNSTRLFMRELNRFGITSVVDAGGGFQNYPDDYESRARAARPRRDDCPPGLQPVYSETEAGAGRLSVVDADDETRRRRRFLPHERRRRDAGLLGSGFRRFPRAAPRNAGSMEAELKSVVRHLAENRWPFRLAHDLRGDYQACAERVRTSESRGPVRRLHWFFDHCETISDRNIERVKALGGGIAVQDRMAFQGEYFVDRYGAEQARRTPPIRRMLELGVPVGAGTDATRVSSYNPFVSLYWLITGKTIGGTALYKDDNRLERSEALRLYTVGSSWFSSEDGKKGSILPGQLADLSVLSADYFSIPEDEIKRLESVLTIVGGKIVYANEPFSKLAPPALPVSPDWSPVKQYGGYCRTPSAQAAGNLHSAKRVSQSRSHIWHPRHLWDFGCDCFAF